MRSKSFLSEHKHGVLFKEDTLTFITLCLIPLDKVV